MRRWTTLEISHHISHIQAVEAAGGVNISGYIEGAMAGAIAGVRRWRATFEVGHRI
jgi:hypothetical protein